jgi:spermidine synthase
MVERGLKPATTCLFSEVDGECGGSTFTSFEIFRMKSIERWIVGACFVVSGATSLILQVAWSKELSYILGSTLYGSATVVAAFMAGLGIGSAVAARFAERLTRPVRAYAFIQFGIAACGAISIPVFRATEPVFRFLFQTFAPGEAGFLLARFLVVFFLILVPVTLMGMTLPIIAGAYARRKEKYGFEAGLIYGVNTLGAMFGTWLAGFFMLPVFGLWMTCVIAGLSDAVVGILALWVDRRLRPLEDIRRDRRQHRSGRGASVLAASPPWSGKQWMLGSLFAFSGAAAMVYEVGWFRLLGLTMGPSVYVFSAILGVFLLGVGLGSTVASRWAERVRFGGVWSFAILEGVLCLLGLGQTFYYNRLPRLNYDLFIWSTSSFGLSGLFWGQIGVAAAVVLPACLVMGALFPVTVRAVRESGDETSPEANIGRLYVMNTFGGIAGSLAAAFLMVPGIGVWNTLIGASLASGVVALLALVLASQPGRIMRTACAVGLLTASVALVATAPPWDVTFFNQGLYREAYTTRKFDLDRPRKEQLVYFGEGINSPVAVFNIGGEATLRVSGKVDASTIPGDFTTQLFVGHLPVMFNENPARVAVIGYGSGMSAMAALTHPEVQSLDIIEIERAVIEASPYFESINLNSLADPRTRVVLDDARVYLTHTGKTYDVITSEPSNPWMAGMSNLFTTDFYRIVRERLSANGIFGQWIQTYELSEETFKVILASIHDVFPHVVVFRPVVGDVVVLASERPIQVPWENFRKRFLEDRAFASFERVGIVNPFQVFFHFYASEDVVQRFIAGTTSRNTDDNVWLEYRMPRNMVEMDTSQTTEEHGIGITLLQTGSEQRLEAFERMLPAVPFDALVSQSLAYQYGMELGVDRTGAVADLWGPGRSWVVQGLRSAIVRRNDPELSASFERWVSDGEAKMRNHAGAIQRLMSVKDTGREVATILNILDTVRDLPMAQAAVANTFYQAGDLQNAEAHYRNALRSVSSYAYYEALVGLGNVAAQRGQRDQAQQFYERAAAHNPYQVIAFHNLASLFLGNDAEKLRQVVERGLLFNPHDPELAQLRTTPRRAP